MTIIQLRYDVFPFRNRNHHRQYQIMHAGRNEPQPEDEEEHDLFVFQDYMVKHFDQNCKVFFILRDFYLLTRV